MQVVYNEYGERYPGGAHSDGCTREYAEYAETAETIEIGLNQPVQTESYSSWILSTCQFKWSNATRLFCVVFFFQNAERTVVCMLSTQLSSSI